MTPVKHTVKTRTLVRDLYAGGWTPTEIRRMLERDNVQPLPTPMTIYRWTHPEKAAQHSNQSTEIKRRKHQAAGFSLAYPFARSPLWLHHRMQVLAGAGVSANAIATVMNIDFPQLTLTEHKVRRMLDERGLTPQLTRSLDLRHLNAGSIR
jgi:hypothetical protein